MVNDFAGDDDEKRNLEFWWWGLRELGLRVHRLTGVSSPKLGEI
jgi:hypothetical protein